MDRRGKPQRHTRCADSPLGRQRARTETGSGRDRLSDTGWFLVAFLASFSLCVLIYVIA